MSAAPALPGWQVEDRAITLPDKEQVLRERANIYALPEVSAEDQTILETLQSIKRDLHAYRSVPEADSSVLFRKMHTLMHAVDSQSFASVATLNQSDFGDGQIVFNVQGEHMARMRELLPEEIQVSPMTQSEYEWHRGNEPPFSPRLVA